MYFLEFFFLSEIPKMNFFLSLVKIIEPKSHVISKVSSRSRSNIFIKSYLDPLELIKILKFSINFIYIRKFPLLKCNYLDLDLSNFEKKRDLDLSTSTINDLNPFEVTCLIIS